MTEKKANQTESFPKDSKTLEQLPVFLGLADVKARRGKPGGSYIAYSLYYDNLEFFVCRGFYKPVSTVFR